MSQLLKANSQWQSFLYHNVYKNLFSLHIGLHVSCYSLMTIPWHEDFCKWHAEIFRQLFTRRHRQKQEKHFALGQAEFFYLKQISH